MWLCPKCSQIDETSTPRYLPLNGRHGVLVGRFAENRRGPLQQRARPVIRCNTTLYPCLEWQGWGFKDRGLQCAAPNVELFHIWSHHMPEGTKPAPSVKKPAKAAFAVGAKVSVRAKIGGGVVLIPATVSAVVPSTEEKGRTSFSLTIDGGTGTAYAFEASLTPRA